jgi:hypothetical protein
MQAQSAPHWHVPVQSQRSPRARRPVVAFAHPHEAFSHRHSLWVSFVIGFLLVRAPLRDCMKKRGPRQRITPTLPWGRRTAARRKAAEFGMRCGGPGRPRWGSRSPGSGRSTGAPRDSRCSGRGRCGPAGTGRGRRSSSRSHGAKGGSGRYRTRITLTAPARPPTVGVGQRGPGRTRKGQIQCSRSSAAQSHYCRGPTRTDEADARHTDVGSSEGGRS